jgi:hypothetical protein
MVIRAITANELIKMTRVIDTWVIRTIGVSRVVRVNRVRMVVSIIGYYGFYGKFNNEIIRKL